MSIEYVFFDVNLRDRFVEFAQRANVVCVCYDDPLGMMVEVGEEYDEVVLDELETHYEMLEREQAKLLSRESDGLNQLAGFRFNLPDGAERMVGFPVNIANRLLAHFSVAEIQQICGTVARSALSPMEMHLCKILAQQKMDDAE